MIDPSAGANGIRQIGDPVLRTRATPVTDFDDRLGRFVDRMFTAMRHANGVGLAANQIGSDMAAFVWEVEGERGVVVNPVVAELSDDVLLEPEGCLSVLGHTFDTPRRSFARVTGQDVDGSPVEVAGEGLLARCLQHECDHLIGKLYIDRLVGEQRRAARQAVLSAPQPGSPLFSR
ncbi:peptide deformylase [Angustibacter aerolatus]